MIGHPIPSCPDKASGVQPKFDTNSPEAKNTCSAAPVMGLSGAGTGGQKPLVGYLSEPILPVKNAEEEQEWQVVDRARGKPQIAGSHSAETSKCKGTNSPIPRCDTPANYAEKLYKQCKKYDPDMKKRKSNLDQWGYRVFQPPCHLLLKKRSVPSPMTLTSTKLSLLKKVPTSPNKKRSP